MAQILAIAKATTTSFIYVGQQTTTVATVKVLIYKGNDFLSAFLHSYILKRINRYYPILILLLKVIGRYWDNKN